MENTRNPVNAGHTIDNASYLPDNSKGVNSGPYPILPGDSNGETPSPSSFKATTPEPPQPLPLPWTWRCHECHHQTRLAVTRTCFNCGHHYCGPNSKRKKKKRGCCTCSFDYRGWQRTKTWQGRLPADQQRRHPPGCWNDCMFPSACYHGHTAPLPARRAVAEGQLNFSYRLFQRDPKLGQPPSAAEVAAENEAREIRKAEEEEQRLAKKAKRARMNEEMNRSSQRLRDSMTGKPAASETPPSRYTGLQRKRPISDPGSGSSYNPATKRQKASPWTLPERTPSRRIPDRDHVKRQRPHSTPPPSPGPFDGDIHIQRRRRASDPTPPTSTALLKWATVAPILRKSLRAFVSVTREYRGLDPSAATAPAEEGEDDGDNDDTPASPRDFLREDTPVVPEPQSRASFLSDLKTALLGSGGSVWSGTNERATPSGSLSRDRIPAPMPAQIPAPWEPPEPSAAKREKRKSPHPKSSEDDGEPGKKRRKS